MRQRQEASRQLRWRQQPPNSCFRHGSSAAVCAELEAEQGRPAAAEDLPRLRELARRLCEAQNLDAAMVDEQLLEAYATCPGGVASTVAGLCVVGCDHPSTQAYG
jgi:hypothetical protein